MDTIIKRKPTNRTHISIKPNKPYNRHIDAAGNEHFIPLGDQDYTYTYNIKKDRWLIFHKYPDGKFDPLPKMLDKLNMNRDIIIFQELLAMYPNFLMFKLFLLENSIEASHDIYHCVCNFIY